MTEDKSRAFHEFRILIYTYTEHPCKLPTTTTRANLSLQCIRTADANFPSERSRNYRPKQVMVHPICRNLAVVHQGSTITARVRSDYASAGRRCSLYIYA